MSRRCQGPYCLPRHAGIKNSLRMLICCSFNTEHLLGRPCTWPLKAHSENSKAIFQISTTVYTLHVILSVRGMDTHKKSVTQGAEHRVTPYFTQLTVLYCFSKRIPESTYKSAQNINSKPNRFETHQLNRLALWDMAYGACVKMG